MPLAFHADPDQKIDQQFRNTLESLIPFIAEVKPVKGSQVLEIGCGEGGNLKAFIEYGCKACGIDLSENKIATARKILAEATGQGKVQLLHEDIHRLPDEADLRGMFDIIVLKDVIEHVPGKEKLLTKLREFLRPDGIIFLAFPPWYNPYGGHQQMSSSLLGKLPYYHLLPRRLSGLYLRIVGESPERIAGFMEIVETRLTTRRFERICRETGFRVVRRRFYLINPIYKYKFGITPRPQMPLLRSLPVIRDYISTSVYYIIAPV